MPDRLVPRPARRRASASRAGSSVWSLATHDLRQPLQMLAVTGSMLAVACSDDRHGVAARQVLDVATALETMLQFVGRLCALEHGDAPPVLVRHHLADLQASVWRRIEPAATRARVSIEVDLPAAAIRTDRELLEPVLEGLMRFAIAYAKRKAIAVRGRKLNHSAIEIVITPQSPMPDRAFERCAFLYPSPAPGARPVSGRRPAASGGSVASGDDGDFVVAIGPALAAIVLRELGGRLALTRDDEGRQSIMLRLPLASSTAGRGR